MTEDSGSSSSLIITCISDDSIQFAKEVYEYLYSALERQKTQFTEESKGLNVARDLITLHVKEKGEEERAGEEESQIRIDRLANISKGTIKSILGSFLKSNISRFKDYEVIELGETFTIDEYFLHLKWRCSPARSAGSLPLTVGSSILTG